MEQEGIIVYTITAPMIFILVCCFCAFPIMQSGVGDSDNPTLHIIKQKVLPPLPFTETMGQQ